MAERMVQKTLLARKGEARPAESEALDDSGFETEGFETEASGNPAPAAGGGASDAGFFLLRDKLAREDAFPEGPAGGAAQSRSNPGSGAEEAGAPSAEPYGAALAPDDRRALAAYRAPQESDGLLDKAVAGSLLDYRLIRGRERRVCPGATDSGSIGRDGPKVHIPSLGSALNVPRRAAVAPPPPAADEPDPLPERRQGAAAAAGPQHEAMPWPDQSQAVTPDSAPADPADEGSEIHAPPLSVPAVSAEAAQEAPRYETAAPPLAAKASPLQALLARAVEEGLLRLRALPAILSGTPHLAYLAALLVLCALGGIYFIAKDGTPGGGLETQVAAIEAADSQAAGDASGAGTAGGGTADSGTAGTPGPSAAVPDGALSLGTLKAAPVLSSAEADAASGAEAPLVTQAGPAAAGDSAAGQAAASEGGDSVTADPAATGSGLNASAESPAAGDGEATAPETTVANAEAETAVPAAVTEGGYTVQFYAARDRASAERALGQMEETLAKVLDGRSLHISEATSSSGRAMYRVRSESFAEASAANGFCDKLKKAGQDCLVLKRQ